MSSGITKRTGRSLSGPFTIFDSASANGTGQEFNISQFNNIGIEISGDSTPLAGVRVKASFRPLTEIDFSAASSPSNPWEYIAINEYLTADLAEGATGYQFSGAAEEVKLFTLNSDDLRSISAEIYNYTGGNVNVIIYPVSNT